MNFRSSMTVYLKSYIPHLMRLVTTKSKGNESADFKMGNIIVSLNTSVHANCLKWQWVSINWKTQKSEGVETVKREPHENGYNKIEKNNKSCDIPEHLFTSSHAYYCKVTNAWHVMANNCTVGFTMTYFHSRIAEKHNIKGGGYALFQI